MSKQLIEALKEFLRTFVLGQIPAVITTLGIIRFGINTDNGTFYIPWMVVLAVLAAATITNLQTALMAAADKWLHESDVKTVFDLKGLDSLAGKKKK